jgi:hypothetical protein
MIQLQQPKRGYRWVQMGTDSGVQMGTDLAGLCLCSLSEFSAVFFEGFWTSPAERAQGDIACERSWCEVLAAGKFLDFGLVDVVPQLEVGEFALQLLRVTKRRNSSGGQGRCGSREGAGA